MGKFNIIILQFYMCVHVLCRFKSCLSKDTWWSVLVTVWNCIYLPPVAVRVTVLHIARLWKGHRVASMLHVYLPRLKTEFLNFYTPVSDIRWKLRKKCGYENVSLCAFRPCIAAPQRHLLAWANAVAWGHCDGLPIKTRKRQWKTNWSKTTH